MSDEAKKGRKTYCRPPLTTAIIAAVEDGDDPIDAALAAGIQSKVTFYDWKHKAEGTFKSKIGETKPPLQPYKAFFDALDIASAKAKTKLRRRHLALAEDRIVDDTTTILANPDLAERVLWKQLQRLESSASKTPAITVEHTGPDGGKTKTTIGVRVYLPEEEKIT